MRTDIRKAAVIGSGVMGAQIAGHLAGCGIEVLLLDVVPNELTPEEKEKGETLQSLNVRNRLAENGKRRLYVKNPSPQNPPAIFAKNVLERIKTGNITDDIASLKEYDWIIEGVTENLAIKRQVMKTIEENRKPGTIVSTNTSGISINQIVSERSEEFKQHFLGTHFFNPPRYIKLLEVIPAKETKPEIIEQMKAFAERRLGKRVVIAKDTPNFIANRIGTYGMMETLFAMEKYGLTIAEVDAVTGPIMGRPKSATFRTMDLVGVDTIAHVLENLAQSVIEEKEKKIFVVPDFMKKMLDHGLLGHKSGKGFYKKVRDENGKKQYFMLDLTTMEYIPQKKPNSVLYESLKAEKSPKKRMDMLFQSDDPLARFLWTTLKKTLLYAAEKIPEITEHIQDVDRAMKWGLMWERGPFEAWDLLGVRRSVERMKEEGEKIPDWIESMLDSGTEHFYEEKGGTTYCFHIFNEKKEPLLPGREEISLEQVKKNGGIIRENKGATLLDIGEDVALLEFHSPNNAIGEDILYMIQYIVEELPSRYKGLVIGNEGKNFCVGANLAMILTESQMEEWEEVEFAVSSFQRAMQALKYDLPIPVVAAPHQMTLGGGAEICLAADRVQAAAESYVGLVEVGVGLLPGGGGNKELLIRHMEKKPPETEIGPVDIMPFVSRTFEVIAQAKVATSAFEAKTLGFLRDGDGISINRDFQFYDARTAALSLYERGYAPPVSEQIEVAGREGYAALQLAIYTLLEGGYISEHDAKIARKVAYVVCGGDVAKGTKVSEQYLLDLEREAFLSLCGEPKSQERMEAILTTGKPLRN